jgi:outer membrane scaffolding protein for murein synthesis (MipA/OmpV family)
MRRLDPRAFLGSAEGQQFEAKQRSDAEHPERRKTGRQVGARARHEAVTAAAVNAAGTMTAGHEEAGRTARRQAARTMQEVASLGVQAGRSFGLMSGKSVMQSTHRR